MWTACPKPEEATPGPPTKAVSPPARTPPYPSFPASSSGFQAQGEAGPPGGAHGQPESTALRPGRSHVWWEASVIALIAVPIRGGDGQAAFRWRGLVLREMESLRPHGLTGRQAGRRAVSSPSSQTRPGF